jgi:hypothetical protein
VFPGQHAAKRPESVGTVLERAPSPAGHVRRSVRAYERTSVNCTPGSQKPSHVEGICASVRASVRIWRRHTEILDSGRVAIWRKRDIEPFRRACA